jgi:hypothetical protein
VVWVSPFGLRGESRLSLEECPVSSISGESVSLVEDFLAHRMLGGGGDPRTWPARRVDAFGVLFNELERWEREADGES